MAWGDLDWVLGNILRHWSRLPRDEVESAVQEASKTLVDVTLKNMV